MESSPLYEIFNQICINKSLGAKLWLDYFFAFLEKCYVNGALTNKLADCHKKSGDAIGFNSEKLSGQKKSFDECIAGYDKSNQTVKSDSVLGSYLHENYLFKERFLPGVPSLRINEQSLAVRF